MASSKAEHRAARDAVLGALPAEERARVIQQAEKAGPTASDADWLVAYAADRSAARIEAAAAAATAAIQASPATGARRVWRWPLRVAVLAGAMLLFAFASFTGAVAQWSLDAGRCRAIGTITAPHLPWISAAAATVATWPTLPFVVASAALLIVIACLGIRKSGPAYRKVFPS